ncbi:hypothetical protein ACWY4P_38175 [Streptomyces sp. LZ34]
MPQARIHTTEPRPQQAAAAAGADDTVLGKHRGRAASEDAQTPPHGRHRRPVEAAAAS